MKQSPKEKLGPEKQDPFSQRAFGSVGGFGCTLPANIEPEPLPGQKAALMSTLDQ